MTETPDAHEVDRDRDRLAPLFAHGLPGSSLRPPAGPLDDDELGELLADGTRLGAVGHLLAAVDDGAIDVTDEQRGRILDVVLRRSATELHLERALLETVEVLEAVGADVRVLKGAAAAHLDHDRPWRRAFNDVDLLVRSDDFDVATGALLVAGLRRKFAEIRPGFDRRFTKAASFVRRDRLEIDLHRTFTMGPFGLAIRLDDLWERHEPFDLGGRALDALCREHRLLHTCYHAVLGDIGGPRPTTLADLGVLATSPVDLDLLAAHTEAWRAEAVVAEAVAAAWRYLGLDPDHDVARWAAGLRVTDAQRDALRSYHTARGGKFASTSIASLRWLPWRDRVRFTAALAFPSRAYLARSGRTRGDRLRRAVRSVRTRARR